MKRLLFIAYHFPPQGGPGVQRSLKFVKYLPDFGIQPTVLTTVGAADRQWCPPDRTLTDEIPDVATVVRVPWPAVTASPDLPSTADARLEEAARLVAAQRLEAIFVSMSPFSDASFAELLSAYCGIPWIADLRDPWGLDEFQVYRSRWHRLIARREMRRALRSASLIVMNTPEAVVALRRSFPEFSAHRVVSITNGYDAADFPPCWDHPPRNRFTIVHAGFLHATAGLSQRRKAMQYRWLGRIESGVELLPRSHYFLLKALEQWAAQEPAILDHVQVELVGEPRPIDRELVARSSVAPLISFSGYIPHHESVNRVRRADLLFLPLHKLPPGARATIVPAKMYEYLATGRPILGALPEGDACDFLARAGNAHLCEPDDVPGMRHFLRLRYRAWKNQEPAPAVDVAFVQTFERRALTQQLAAELHALCGRPPVRLSPEPAELLV